MRMRAAAVLHNNISAWSELSPQKRDTVHSVLAFEIKPPKVQKGDKDFVQILHVGGNHWVTVTNIGCQENRIKVFDSLRQKLSKKEKQKLCSSLAVLIKNLTLHVSYFTCLMVITSAGTQNRDNQKSEVPFSSMRMCKIRHQYAILTPSWHVPLALLTFKRHFPVTKADVLYL